MDEIIDKIYLTLAIVFILTSTLFFSGCFESGEQRYAKGEIEVVFKENVTKNEAREIVYSFNCTPQEWWGARYAYWRLLGSHCKCNCRRGKKVRKTI